MRRAANGLPPALILDPQDGGLAIARALRRRGVPVLVLGSASALWVARSRGVTGVELPPIAGAEERWVERIVELGDGDAVLMTCSDRSCALVAEHRDAIPAAMRSFESADGSHLRVMDKSLLYEAAERVGVRHPWWRMLASEEDLESAGRTVHFPCLLKPNLSHEWRRLFGEERVFVIDSVEALVERARPALAAGVSLMLTEHVPGPESSIQHHVALRLPDGSYAFEYMSRKLRQYPLDFGAASAMVTEAVPLTRELSRRLLEETGFVGLAMVEAKIHEQTGEPVLIEVNVRVPRVFGLGDAAGADVSYRTYRVLAGLPLDPAPAARDGVTIVVPALELRAAWERLRRGDVRPLELLRSYRGARELGPLDLRDPGPAIALATRVARARMRRG